MTKILLVSAGFRLALVLMYDPQSLLNPQSCCCCCYCCSVIFIPLLLHSFVILAVKHARKKRSISVLLTGRGKLSNRHECDADDNVVMRKDAK